MLRLLPLLLLAACFGGAWQAAAAQDVAVQARVDATTVGSEEVVTYTLEIEGAPPAQVRTPQPPGTTGLVLLRPTPTMQHDVVSRHGAPREQVAFQWQFRPVREGEARIRPARVTVRSETYVTGEIRLRVVPQAQRPVPPTSSAPSRTFSQDDRENDNGASEADNFFVEATASARRAYQNEQVMLTYRLFFPENVHLQGSRLADTWDAAGFWREELDVPDLPAPRSVDREGRRYHTIVLKRVAVFPTRTGTLRVDPLRIETHVAAFGRSPYSARQSFGLHRRLERLELASEPVTIDVVPLPDDAPSRFNGAVGRYQLHADLSRTQTDVGQPLRLRVHLTGRGNIAMLEPPVLDVPDAFEVYDPAVNASLNRRGAQVRGTKTFTYTLVPRSSGTYTLPAVTFSYFDPEAERYDTLRTAPLAVRVTGVDEAPPAAGLTGEGFPVDDIAGVMTHASGWTRTGGTPLYRNVWAYAALVVPALLVAGLLAYRRHRTRLATDRPYARRQQAHPVARRHLEQARALRREGQPRPFYAEVERALLSFIGNRLDVAAHGLTREQLDARLAAAGVSGSTRHRLQALLEECDRARFAPAPPHPDALRTAHDRAAELIAALDGALA